MFGTLDNDQAMRVLAVSASFQAMDELTGISRDQHTLSDQIDPEAARAPRLRKQRRTPRPSSFSWFLRPLSGHS